MVSRLSPDDAALYYLDRQDPAAYVGSLLILDGESGCLDYDSLMSTVERRLQFTPRYRRLVREVWMQMAAPVWVDDHDFDITYHVRRSALPRPGTDEQLRELVAILMSRPLDRGRPLWEMNVVEGLDGGRVAILTKSHRVMIAGADAPEINQTIVDNTPDSLVPCDDIWLPAREPGGAELVVGALTEMASLPWRALDSLLAVPPRAPVRSLARAVCERAESVVRLRRRDAPGGLLDARAGQARRFTATVIDVDQCVQLAVDRGVTIADVLLAVLAGAVRRWLLSRLPAVHSSDTVRVMLLCNLCADSAGTEMAGTEMVSVDPDRADGIRMSGELRDVVIDLPVGEANPAIRLARIAYLSGLSASGHGTASPSPRSGQQFPSDVGSGTFHAMSSRAGVTLSRRAFTLSISLACSSAAAQYVAGSRIIEMYPVPALTSGRVLAVAITAYGNRLHVAFSGDRDAMWDLDAMPDYMKESLNEFGAAR